MKKTIYENDNIEVCTTGQDYDFIAFIRNKSNNDISFTFYNDEDSLLNFTISADDWAGILADEEGREKLKAIKNREFTITLNPIELSEEENLSKVDLYSIAKRAIAEMETTEYEHDTILGVLGIDEEDYDEIMNF